MDHTTSQTAETVHLDFAPLKAAVAAQFERMRQHPLYRTAATKDQMWDVYLGSFPPGTDPIYRERTEHNCNCCKSFIRAVGNTVAIIDGQTVSLWDIQIGGAYQTVVDALSRYVKAQPIENMFLHNERVAGVDKNFQELMGEVKTWQHFFVNIPANFVNADPGSKLSDTRATRDVMLRGLTEIKPDAIETILELIAQNSLYRGEEHQFALIGFQRLQTQWAELTFPNDRERFVWAQVAKNLPQSVSRFRNTAIGTLAVDLSNGMELEDAVKSFEQKVAPTNYKRPTALVTPKMLENAKKTIEELGLMSALERRYAVMTDITVNNVLWADRSAKSQMTGNVFDDLAAALPSKPKNLDKVEEITIEKFLADVLPKAESVEVMFENRHRNNLVSLVAPVDPTAGRLFKWDNNFSWSYNGEVADSIRERVKKAGGNVTGDLCCRLAWSNYDDLDLHMVEPDGNHIYYGNKGPSRCGGQLDVDMNAGGGSSRTPVENIFYGDRSRMKEGVYKLYVNNYNKRETIDVGFEVEMDYLGTVNRFVYEKAVNNRENITVVEFKYSKKDGIEIIKSLPSTESTRTLWNVPTQTFHKVNIMMFSPNHWDGQGVGNKHYFFMMEGCQNDEVARGFFNEFLRSDLDAHRKAFEMVGTKMKTDNCTQQLSGLGFNSTTRNHVIARVKGAFTRTLKVTF